MILAIVAALDLDMLQLDIKTAFLYGLLQEEIYMEQAEGFAVPGKENDVCRLVKCIYGLKVLEQRYIYILKTTLLTDLKQFPGASILYISYISITKLSVLFLPSASSSGVEHQIQRLSSHVRSYSE